MRANFVQIVGTVYSKLVAKLYGATRQFKRTKGVSTFSLTLVHSPRLARPDPIMAHKLHRMAVFGKSRLHRFRTDTEDDNKDGVAQVPKPH